MLIGELEDDPEIRKEFERFDLDKNGFITKSLFRNEIALIFITFLFQPKCLK